MRRRFWFLVIAFSVSFITVTGLSFYYLKQFTTITEYTGKVDESNSIITELYKIRDALNVCDINEYSYMLTLDSSHIDSVNNYYRSIYHSLVRLGELYPEESPQQKTLLMLRSALLMRMDNYRNNIARYDTAVNALPIHYYYGRNRRTECLKYIDIMLHRESSTLNEYALGRVYFQHITASTLKYILLVFCIITIILFILVIDELRKRIKSQEELQTQLIDLENSHSELQQIAFASSHNLQEPLRKMKIFGDRLLWLQKEDTDEDARDCIIRINAAADQVKGLISELVSLTSLVNDNQQKTDIDLGELVDSIVKEIQPKIKKYGATIREEALPGIKGYKTQLEILFRNLLDNSLKFSQEGIPPLVIISAGMAHGHEIPGISLELSGKKYHCITVSDNGIGFENKYINKIFLAFQRLQDGNSIHEGRGIGLAICKRIMVNHSGFIIAHGDKGNGATFKLYFPVE